ncbi:MAG: type II/IV secretion system ATPase subunit [Ignisphaera sp.]|nr:type II/IV secretion system ATPase subunit [Ignisphaera sp.]MDW8084806.1 type II/IV secretion system ATPase subunit [Ignisphaera sp.]
MAVLERRMVDRYSIGFRNHVTVSIAEGIDGKLLYIVSEPQLDSTGERIYRSAYNYITSDVRVLKEFSSFETLDDGYNYARNTVYRICRKIVKNCKVEESQVEAATYYILRDFIGYGEIDPLIRDPNIEDVTCDGVDRPIYVFHSVYEWLESNKVLNRENLERITRRLAYRSGREASIAQPIVEGILKPEGYRVHIVLDVVSSTGHSFTIRRFRESPYTIVELINRGMLSPAVGALLWLAAESRQGMVFYGPTGSGKTTLLNAIAMFIPPELKIVTAEDTPEIRLPFHDNWVSMITRLSSDPYIQNITLQAQVESAMRQRPDVLILGEIRSREAYSFFQAVSTGHGGLTTVHAESIESLIRRLTAPPMSVLRSLIATAKLYVHVLRLPGARSVRKVAYIYEVENYSPVDDRILVKTLARWERYRDRWLVDVDGSRILRDISDLMLLSYEDVVADLYRRTAILRYAAINNFDIVSLHALARRYRRDPEGTYEEVVKKIDGGVVIEKLESVERRIL